MIKIIVKKGSIADEVVDAIVVPANSYGLMDGGVAAAIKRVSGAIIEADAVRQSPIEVGSAVITQPGLLPCRYVIHASIMKNPAEKVLQENIKKAVHIALKIADKNNFSKIAMPGMGTGVGGYDPVDGAKIIIDEIRQFKPNHLKEVLLIDISEAMVEAFNDAICMKN